MCALPAFDSPLCLRDHSQSLINKLHNITEFLKEPGLKIVEAVWDVLGPFFLRFNSFCRGLRFHRSLLGCEVLFVGRWLTIEQTQQFSIYVSIFISFPGGRSWLLRAHFNLLEPLDFLALWI